ncbi:hypothetical protein PybrP1_012490, partial [[Pythium] brassicae (nom. inval.)]
ENVCYCKSGKGGTVASANLISGTFPTAPGTCTLSVGIDIVLNDVGSTPAGTARDCCATCKQAFGSSKAFAFLDNVCYCKSAKGATIAKAGVTSGVFA